MPPRALRRAVDVWAHALVPDATAEASPKKPRRPVLPKKPAPAVEVDEDDEQPEPIKARRQDGDDDDDLLGYLFTEEPDEDEGDDE